MEATRRRVIRLSSDTSGVLDEVLTLAKYNEVPRRMDVRASTIEGRRGLFAEVRALPFQCHLHDDSGICSWLPRANCSSSRHGLLRHTRELRPPCKFQQLSPWFASAHPRTAPTMQIPAALAMVCFGTPANCAHNASNVSPSLAASEGHLEIGPAHPAFGESPCQSY